MEILQKSNFINGFFINDKCPSREWRLKLFEGPTVFAGVKTKEQETLDKVDYDLIERSKHCCKICGVYLEKDEINDKMRCTICYNKKVDDK